jgi:hypothetical protein
VESAGSDEGRLFAEDEKEISSRKKEKKSALICITDVDLDELNFYINNHSAKKG